MGMTLAEKILAAKSGQETVSAGDLVNAKLDWVMANDVTAPIAIKDFYNSGAKKVWDKDKIILMPSHFTPNKDIQSADQVKIMRDFAFEQEITHFYELGEAGVEHAVMPELGLIVPGDLGIGADSHTCTGGGLAAFTTGMGSTDIGAGMITGEAWFKVPVSMKFTFHGKLPKYVSGKDLILRIIGDIGVDGALYASMEIGGETIESLKVVDRLTICNMAIEAGGKNAIIPFDEVTKEYVEARTKRPYTIFKADADAEYVLEKEYDVTGMEPLIAYPFLPSNVRRLSEAVKDAIKMDQVYIGSCTNGRFEDMEIAAEIIKGHKVAKGTRLLVVPASQQTFRRMMESGVMETFLDAGAAVSTPTCGACLGGHMGVLAKGETCASTTNRNFRGRMGHPESEAYLMNPAIAAATAVVGRIASPDEL